MHVVTSRILPLTTLALFAAIVACSDTNSQGDIAGPNPSASSGPKGSGDTTTPPSGNPAPTTPSDSGTTPGNPSAQPVAKFTLNLHIGTPHPGATDTLTNDPLAGASVKVIKETTTFVQHPGADTVQFNDTVVGTGTSGADGLVSFANLDGTQIYKIQVAAPAGSDLGDTILWINRAYSIVLDVPVMLRRR
jgi:hypothetical protein